MTVTRSGSCRVDGGSRFGSSIDINRGTCRFHQTVSLAGVRLLTGDRGGNGPAPCDTEAMARRNSRFDVWLERLVFSSFVVTMIVEWRALRGRKHRTFGDLDDATRAELADPSLPADELIPVGYERRDTAASLTMLVGNIAVNLAMAPVYGRIGQGLFNRRKANLGKGALGFAGAMVMWDFLYYWEHRWMHEVRLLWANHVTHHSSERYNLSTALRQPWSSFLTFWVMLPMPFLGFSPALTQRAGELNLLYQYWIHTETVDRLPPRFERLFNTPSHHRVHHGANPQYIDRNYGGILIIWDKLFGTFEPEVRRVKYGLTKNIKTFNPIHIGYHEFVDIARDVRHADCANDRIRFILGRPGWQPAIAA